MILVTHGLAQAALGIVICGLLGCHEVLEPTPSDSWAYQQEQMACVAEATERSAAYLCRKLSWDVCERTYGKCPAPQPLP